MSNYPVAGSFSSGNGGSGGGLGTTDNIGDIKLTACGTAPSGWLICDGTAVSRETYSDLFLAIGTAYGGGDGSTTFNIPNLKGRVPVGFNSAETEFNTLGKTGGEKTHKLTVSEMPSHSHSIVKQTNSTTRAPCFTLDAYLSDGPISSVTGLINSTGGNGAHNILQPYIALNYIIYTGVTA